MRLKAAEKQLWTEVDGPSSATGRAMSWMALPSWCSPSTLHSATEGGVGLQHTCTCCHHNAIKSQSGLQSFQSGVLDMSLDICYFRHLMETEKIK